MKVSIITTSYNAQKHIWETINSVLSQDFSDFEYIIIDDCSNDDTISIIQSYEDPRIKVYKNKENLGIVWSRNRWLELAQEKYVCFLDHDDLRSSTKKLSKQVNFMERHTDVGMVWSYCICFEWNNDLEWLKFWVSDKEIRSKILITNQFSTCSVMFRRNLLDKVWYLNNKYEKVDDYDLWLKIWKISQFANIPEFLVKYRYHSLNTTKQKNNLRSMRFLTISLIKKNKKNYPNAWWGIIIQYFLIYLPVNIFWKIRKYILSS